MLTMVVGLVVGEDCRSIVSPLMSLALQVVGDLSENP